MELNNFKCFRHKEIGFSSDITTISGRNGVGKTTIADAILWCLFGKNTAGQSDFNLKTHDENGIPIPNLDHSVELVIECDNVQYNIKRTLKETWVKKRGSDEQVFKNNTTEYLINGETMTATDYKKHISRIVDEDVFRAITNPIYFPSLKWQAQREFLMKMVGNVQPEAFATDADLKNLVDYLNNSGEDIIAYRKHLSYQIKQIKDKLDKIPVRLEEQHKALPEKTDWEAAAEQHATLSSQQEQLSQKIVTIRSGNGGDVLREQIRSEIRVTQRRMDEIENDIRTVVRQRQDEKNRLISEESRKFNNLLNTQRDFEMSVQSLSALAERCKTTAEDNFLKEQKYIRSKWPETQVPFSDDDARCSLCGQILPPDMIEHAREQFNIRKAELRKELTSRAEAAKQLLADASKEAESYLSKKEQDEKNLDEVKQSINEVFAQKARLEKTPVKTVEEHLSEDTEYNSLKEKLVEQQKRLQSVGIDEDSVRQLEELDKQKAQNEDAIRKLQEIIATKAQYDRIIALIEDIESEQKALVSQLSELERKEDIARRYQDKQNTILESRINENFSLVKWHMFRTVNNGGDPFQEPYCECYVDGVAYHDGLNQAARLNAGLDIINTLCRHYNVAAPIVLDNSESTINILPTIGQQIRLQVADTDLQII